MAALKAGTFTATLLADGNLTWSNVNSDHITISSYKANAKKATETSTIAIHRF
jgi:hypothetical protein